MLLLPVDSPDSKAPDRVISFEDKERAKTDNFYLSMIEVDNVMREK